jgi:hypothetical protein
MPKYPDTPAQIPNTNENKYGLKPHCLLFLHKIFCLSIYKQTVFPGIRSDAIAPEQTPLQTGSVSAAGTVPAGAAAAP